MVSKAKALAMIPYGLFCTSRFHNPALLSHKGVAITHLYANAGAEFKLKKTAMRRSCGLE